MIIFQKISDMIHLDQASKVRGEYIILSLSIPLAEEG
jgi:hypothetical protein